ncbi:MAG: PQQ-binding-like beta-propeller repeat protein [Bacteroidota bacterium]
MHIKPLLISLVLACISGAAVAQSPATSWPAYRGPSDDGHSTARNVPVSWSETTNVVWRTKIPGRGWSSPVVMDGMVWITTSEPVGKKLKVIGIKEKDGSISHFIEVFDIEFPQEQHPLNTYASPSPVIEPGRLYVHFGAYGTACLDTRSGKILWKRTDLQCDHGVGPGSSPMLYKNLLILTFDGQDLQYLIALDKQTGKTVWKSPRSLDYSSMAPDARKALTTPVVVRFNGRDQLVSVGPHAVMAYEPLTGQEIWKVRFEGYSGSSRPVADDQNVYINCGLTPACIMAIKLSGTGDKTGSGIVWSNKRSMAARSSPLLIDGLFYMVNSAGQAKCIDTQTGKELWVERVGEETSASPVFAGGMIYTFDQGGLTAIIRPGRTFTRIAENRISDGFMASPAITDGSLYLRSKSELIKIGR